MAAVACSPVAAAVEVTEASADRIVAAATISAGEIVFAGHYPGYPVFPAVCLMDLAQQGIRRSPVTAIASARLVGIETSRFSSPVRPDDRVTVDVRFADHGPARGGGDLRADAVFSTDRGVTAKIRMIYQRGA